MRHRRAPGATTRAAVVDAALRVADEVGIEALTIRAVAKAAGVPAMSLYAHFSRKDELFDLMYAEVALRLYADAEHATWQQGFLALSHQIRKVLLEHPHWAPLLSRPVRPMPVPLRERLLALMVSSGVPEKDALAALTTLGLLSLGLTLVELKFREPDGSSQLGKRFDRIRQWSKESSFGAEHPVTQKAFTKLRRLDLSANFELAVHTYITGLEIRFGRNFAG